MYPASFDYLAPDTLEEALSLLERHGDEAKVLAGGQSLIPLMKLRFAAPTALVDINRLEGLDRLAEEDGALTIGALVRHKDCERSELLRGRWGTLGDAAPLISDPIVRNVGTVGGSLAHADPQGDWGSALLAMRAEVEVRGPAGTRSVVLDDFLVGPFTTTLEPDEILTSVRVPDPGPQAGGTYLKLERKVGDFATVGVAVHVAMEDGVVKRAGIALTAVGPKNLRAAAAEDSLVGAELDDASIREAAALAAQAAQPRADLRGSVEYKRQVVRVFTERGLRRAAAAARGADQMSEPARPRRPRPVGGRSMTEQTCPNCGAPVPREVGQHALAPSAGVVACPSCGATLTLDKPGAEPDEGTAAAGGVERTTEGGWGEATGEDTFAGQETVEGVMDELRDKEGGPE